MRPFLLLALFAFCQVLTAAEPVYFKSLYDARQEALNYLQLANEGKFTEAQELFLSVDEDELDKTLGDWIGIQPKLKPAYMESCIGACLLGDELASIGVISLHTNTAIFIEFLLVKSPHGWRYLNLHFYINSDKSEIIENIPDRYWKQAD